MSVLSAMSCALLSAASAFTLVTAAGCGTDAKGVDDCRDIEEARCSAAKTCGVVSDVAACQRFYRDQCLHGLSVSSPGAVIVKACVATISAAGMCAMQGVDTLLSDCADPTLSTSAPTAQTACEIVTNPEKANPCAFLMPGAAAGGGGGAGGGGASGGGGTGIIGGAAGSADAGTAG